MNQEPEYLEADQDYIRERNSCIPEAEKFANKYCGQKYKGDKSDELARDRWNNKWTRTFIRRMDHLYNKLSKDKGAGNETSNTRKSQGDNFPGDQDPATETCKVLELRGVGNKVETVFSNAQSA